MVLHFCLIGTLPFSSGGFEVAAHYEYAPFGSLISLFGVSAFVNPFRFSSEYIDDVTGFVYYNFRHLNHYVGRWMAMDPLGIFSSFGERLYVFCDNAAIMKSDSLGLKIVFDESSIPQDMVNGRKDRGYMRHSPIRIDLKCSFWGIFTVSGVATRKIFLKAENDPSWNRHFTRYDIWGSHRTNAEERQCALRHEMDHYQSYDELFAFLHEIDALDGTNQGFFCCEDKKKELLNQYNFLFGQARMKSSSYDIEGKNHGGVYPR